MIFIVNVLFGVHNMTEQKSYRKIDDGLRQSLNKLWDDCFGDLPLPQQRMLKAYGLQSSKEAFFHKKKDMMDPDAWKNINIDENHFEPQSEQVLVAQQTVDDIIKEFKKGKSHTAHYLRHFLKDKKVKVSVCKWLSYDAGFDGYNPLTKELRIDLCAGCFYFAKMHPKMVNKDALAITVGHEIGHAIEKLNRSAKCEAQTVSSNSWEVENFCDMVGFRLATDAGFTLLPRIEMLHKGIDEHREPKQPNPHPPLYKRLEFAELCRKVLETDVRNVTLFDDKVLYVQWDDNEADKKLWQDLKVLAQKKRD